MALTATERDLLLADLAEVAAEVKALRRDITALRSAAGSRQPRRGGPQLLPAGHRSAA